MQACRNPANYSDYNIVIVIFLLCFTADAAGVSSTAYGSVDGRTLMLFVSDSKATTIR